MLDNLKLGYGGTQAEMARLINDSKVLGDVLVDDKSVKDVSFDKIIEAIHVIQTNMGITGTTAKEASTTIQGSLSSMQASWQNLLTGMADETADIDQLILNFVDSIGTFAENLLPRVTIAMKGLIKVVQKLLPQIPALLQQFLPVLLEGVTNLLNGVIELLPQFVETILQVVPDLITALIEMLPTLLSALVEIVVQIMNALSGMIPTIVAAIMEVLPALITALIEATPQLLEAAITLLMAIIEAVPTIIDALLDALPMIIDTIITTLLDNLPLIVNAAVQLFMGIIKAIPQIVGALIKNIPTIIGTIIRGLLEGIPDLILAGVDLLAGLCEGLLNPKTLWNTIKKLGNNLLDGIKGFFGIASPSKLMANVIGKNLALGIGKGFENNIGKVNDQIANAIDLEEMAVNVRRTGSGLANSGKSVVVNQYNTYSQAHSRYELYKSKQDTAAAVRLAMGTV